MIENRKRCGPKKAAEAAGALASSDAYVREYLGPCDDMQIRSNLLSNFCFPMLGGGS